MSLSRLGRHSRRAIQQMLSSDPTVYYASSVALDRIASEMSDPDWWVTGTSSSPVLGSKRSHDGEEHLSSKKQKMQEAGPTGEVSHDNGKSTIGVAVTKHGHVKRFKKPARAQPTKLFKELVERALNPDMAFGHKTDYEYFYMPPLTLNAQTTGITSATPDAFEAARTIDGTAYRDQWMFHPYYFLDAASVMFNNKAVTQNNYLPTTANTLGYGSEPGFEAASAGAIHSRFTVVNSGESWVIKNNTQRTITMKIILCAPKQPSTMFDNPYDVTTAAYTANGANDALFGPTIQWAQQLFDDRKANLTTNTPTYLKTLPMMSHGFNQLFKTEVTTVVLEPGTTYDYHVEGPKDLLVDLEKYFQGPKLHDIRTYCRAPIFIWHGDLCGNSVTPAGLRFSYSSTDKGTGVYLERKKYCKIQCPVNLVGPVVTAFNATKPQQIAFNRPRYFTTVFSPVVVPAATNTEVEKQNPQATATPS